MNSPLYVTAISSKSAADVVSAKRSDGVVVFGEALASTVGIDGSEQYGKNMDRARRFVTNPPLRPDPTTPAYLTEHLAQ